MKRNNKKGFTIVELVIVIAVIAILAAVMIPTFSSIITEANKSSAMQEANGIYKNYLITHDYKAVDLEDVDGYVTAGGYFFEIENGQFQDEPLNQAPTAATGYTYVLTNGIYLLVAETPAPSNP